MCGIAGFVGTGDAGTQLSNVSAMVRRLRHRGPDENSAAAVQGDGQLVIFGHTRLSIIDISGGHQPITTDDGRYTIIYNGELYNFLELKSELESSGIVFHTRSDTEVVLQAYRQWGSQAFLKFRGMFALAIWDAAQQSLILARDHFGEKPLYYRQSHGTLIFASELPALLAHPDVAPSLNREMLAEFLAFKYVPGANSLVTDVYQVEPGHFSVWHAGGLRTERFYRPPLWDPEFATGKLTPDLLDQFRSELRESVRLRMRSDVEVGAFLSGGLDSSTVVTLMSQETSRRVKTFSVGFEDERFSELWAARLLAERVGTDHYEAVITPDDYMTHFEDATWHRGAPLSEMADVSVYCLSRLASQHVKVVLSGEGADELMGGYPKHWGDSWVTGYQRYMPAALDNFAVSIGRKLGRGNHRVESVLRAASEREFVRRQAAWFGSVSPDEVKVLAPGLNHDRCTKPVWDEDPGDRTDPLSRVLLFDQMVWLPGTLLARGDRLSMAWSVEGRMPFLDPKLAELVSKLPRAAFVEGRVGKQILRQAMEPALPREIIERPKSGFRVPFSDWLRGPMRSFAQDHLLATSAQTRQLLEPQQVEQMLSEHINGARDRTREIWSLLSLEIFLQQLARGFSRSNEDPVQRASASLAY